MYMLTCARIRTLRLPGPKRSYSLGPALRKRYIKKPPRAAASAQLRKTPPAWGGCRCVRGPQAHSKILSRNTDARKTARLADGSTAKKNFNIFYEIDGEEVGCVLRADEYGGDEDFSWVLLESVEGP